MTLPMLAKEDALPLFHQAMRDEFQKGGSYGAFLLTLLGLAGRGWFLRSSSYRNGMTNRDR